MSHPCIRPDCLICQTTAVLDKGDPEEMKALIATLWDHLEDISMKAGRVAAILEGTWPDARTYLKRALNNMTAPRSITPPPSRTIQDFTFNNARARAVKKICDARTPDDQTNLRDTLAHLLADIGHLCDRENLLLSDLMFSASMQYDFDTADTGTQFESYKTPCL